MGKRKVRALSQHEADEERALTAAIFAQHADSNNNEAEDTGGGFVIDRTGGDTDHGPADGRPSDSSVFHDDEMADVEIPLRELKRAEDESVVPLDEYTRRLREQFVALQRYDTSVWTDPEIPVDDPMIPLDTRVIETVSHRPGRLPDATSNLPLPSPTRVTCLSFLPSPQSLLAFNTSHKTLALVRSTTNALVAHYAHDLRNPKMALIGPTECILVGSAFHAVVVDWERGVQTMPGMVGIERCRWMDVKCDSGGKRVVMVADTGKVVVVNATDKQPVAVLDGSAHSVGARNLPTNFQLNRYHQVEWVPRSDSLLWTSYGADLALWDLRNTSVPVSSLHDPARLCITALSASTATPTVAIGDTSGTVSIYDSVQIPRHNHNDNVRGNLKTDASIPYGSLKTLGNLSTLVTQCEFSPCGHWLAMASHVEKGAMRLASVTSGATVAASVVAKWPGQCGKVTRMAFNPESTVMAVGGNTGRVQMYKLPE